MAKQKLFHIVKRDHLGFGYKLLADEFADEQMSSDEPPEGFEPPPPEDDEEYSYGNDDYSESNDFDYQ